LKVAYANETLRIGRDLGFSVVGDDLDFAIVASSLVEAIGGKTRIVLAIGDDSIRYYPEISLGTVLLSQNTLLAFAKVKELGYTADPISE
jgi:hypothetical protein